jgi:hypothetical protein
MHQLFAYLIAQQQADRIREARESRIVRELRRTQELEASGGGRDRGVEADGFAGLDARRAVALVALGLSRAAAATSRAAASTSRAAAGTARRIDPCLDEAVIRRAVGAGGR